MAFIEMRLKIHSRTDTRSRWLAMTPWDGATQSYETELIDLTIRGNDDEIHIIMPVGRAREMIAELERAIPHTERGIRLKRERLAREAETLARHKNNEGEALDAG